MQSLSKTKYSTILNKEQMKTLHCLTKIKQVFFTKEDPAEDDIDNVYLGMEIQRLKELRPRADEPGQAG